MKNNLKPNCPHINTVQYGTETEITTYCAACNEVVKIEKVKR